jgi:hypothetical protein
MIKVAVVSAFGNSIKNIEKAEVYCKYVLKQGQAPFASHVFYSPLLNDGDVEERKLGMEAGKAFIRICDEMWVFVVKGFYSDGMKEEIELAKAEDILIKYFDVTDIKNIQEFVFIAQKPCCGLSLALAELAATLLRTGDLNSYNKALDNLLGTELKERDLEAEAIFEENKHV